jgi:hypothetical protein
MNVYTLVDKELERLHFQLNEARRQDERSSNMIAQSQFGISSGGAMGGAPQYSGPEVRHLQAKIDRFHDYMFRALETTDLKIQEKVAELALADVQKEKP